ncbi:hypothetical protein CapIbe_011499 [Capra ibex]
MQWKQISPVEEHAGLPAHMLLHTSYLCDLGYCLGCEPSIFVTRNHVYLQERMLLMKKRTGRKIPKHKVHSVKIVIMS